MTALHDSGAPGLTAGRPALRRLVVDPDAFAADVWGRGPLLTRAQDLPRSFDDLFSEAAVDELVSTHGLRTPFLRVAQDGATLPNGRFTSGAGVGAGIADQLDDTRLAALFGGGATLVLQALHRTWPPVLHFTQALAAELGHPVQVNAYVTPPQSRGFDDHYDVHDVFVLQVAGEKRWRLHRPVHDAPLRDQPWTDRRDAVRAEAEREPLLDVTLRPGDCLYLPRGTLHAATALGDVSTHLTFGVHTWHRHHLAEDLVAAALADVAADPEVRRSLPTGLDPTSSEALEGHVELVRERLLRAVRDVPVQRLATALAARSSASSRPAPVGPVGQLRASQQLEATDVLVLRDGLAARVDGGTGGASLRSRAGTVDVGDVDPEVLDDLLAGHLVEAGRIGVDTARRLLVAGVVVRP